MSILSRLRLAETPPRPDTSERGDSAVSWSWGGGGRRLRDPEYLYELTGSQGSRIYRRMRWSDPHIAGLRQAQNLPLLRASVTIESSDPGDKDAVEKAELVRRLLLEDFPWRSFLTDTCLCADYGFCVFEIIWRVEDGEARFRLALRPTSSIATADIYVKDGAVERVVQRPDTGGEFEIPGEKLVWFCHDKEGDSFVGRSIMRPMYKPWKIKEELEVELPILVRKWGIPDITTQGEPSPELATALDEAGANFGVNPEGFFRHTDEVSVQLLIGSASVTDVLEAIKERNTEITAVCQAQVLDLGTSNSGSRALGMTLGDMFSDSIQAQANYREDVLNAHGGLIHQVVAYNFPSDDNLPRLRFGNVQHADMKALAQAMLWFSQAFGTLDGETQDWARAELNMPEGPARQVVTPTSTEPDMGGAQASEAYTHGDGLRLSERRRPVGVERYVALDEVAARFENAKTALREATQDTRKALVAELVRRARVAAGKDRLAAFAASAPPMVDKLTKEIRAVLADFYAAGHAQVADELRRQRDGEPVVEEIVAERSGETVAMAEPKKPKKPVTVDPQYLSDRAEIAARHLAQATQAAVAEQVARLAVVAVTDVVLADMALRASDAAALQMSAVVTDLMQAGRAAQAAAVRADIELATYSAILDTNTCDICDEMDGTESTDIDEAEDWTPNSMCDGGDRCRCMTIYTLRQP